MIAIVTAVFLALSVLLATFLGFSPNFYKLTESDYSRRISTNTVMYGLQFGEVAIRAKTLANPDKKTMTLSMGYTKKKNDAELDSMGCEIFLTTEGTVNVMIDYEPHK